MVEVEVAGEEWKLSLECGHRTTRRVERSVLPTRAALPAPKHIYCSECPPRRQVPGEHEELLADFDRRLDLAVWRL